MFHNFYSTFLYKLISNNNHKFTKKDELCKLSSINTILQSLRGQMTTIILDDASFHNPLRQSEEESQDNFRKLALQGLLDKGHHPELHKSGIDIVIAISKRHECVERAEHIIKKIKFLLALTLKTWIFHDMFDFICRGVLINH